MAILEHYTLMTLAVVFGFSWLVFVHELGHYLLAKWNGVRVHVFSIGMGPYLLSFTKGETLYVISMVPIGGYVKMAGQDDMKLDLAATKDPKDYRNKRPGQRAAILAAGATFNLIFAYIGFALCYYAGVEMPSPIIGKVDPQSPLAKAVSKLPGGRTEPNPLQEGDHVTMVNGEPIKNFFELTMAIGSAGSNRDMYIQYLRKDPNGRDLVPSRLPAIVRTERDAAVGAASVGLNKYFEEKTFHLGFETRERVFVNFLIKDNPAVRAGLQLGDRLVSVDGKNVVSGDEFSDVVAGSNGRELAIEVEREGKTLPIKATPEFNKEANRYLLGIRMDTTQQVVRIDPSCSAYSQGLRTEHYVGIAEYSLNWDRIGLYFGEEPVTKNPKIISVPLDGRQTAMAFTHRVPADIVLRAPSIAGAMGMAWGDTLGHSTMVFVVLHRLMTGEVDMKNMAGPVGMAGILTTVASRRSFTYYLWFLALLSLNLGVLQFVPIPLLDGWHLVMVAVEKLKGSPVPLKVQEAFQYAGLFLILALLLFVTKNDIMRFFIH